MSDSQLPYHRLVNSFRLPVALLPALSTLGARLATSWGLLALGTLFPILALLVLEPLPPASALGVTATIAVGTGKRYLAVNETNNRIYVTLCNGGGYVAAIDGNTIPISSTTLVDSPGGVAVNSRPTATTSPIPGPATSWPSTPSALARASVRNGS